MISVRYTQQLTHEMTHFGKDLTKLAMTSDGSHFIQNYIKTYYSLRIFILQLLINNVCELTVSKNGHNVICCCIEYYPPSLTTFILYELSCDIDKYVKHKFGYRVIIGMIAHFPPYLINDFIESIFIY